MKCPKCHRDQFTSQSNDTHYICVRNQELAAEDTGCGSQFYLVVDDYIRFPYNVIFNEKNRDEFFRKPYLKLNALNLAIDG